MTSLLPGSTPEEQVAAAPPMNKDTVVTFRFPKIVPECQCAMCQRLGVDELAENIEQPVFEWYRLVKVYDDGTIAEMDEDEWKALERHIPKQAEWLTPIPQRTWFKAAQKLLGALMRDSWSGPFKAPVDPIALNIPDYPNIIKHPMDLGTVNERLRGNLYMHPDDFVSDVRLVFRNTYNYNKKDSEVWRMAEKLSRKFETDLMKVIWQPPAEKGGKKR
jgi:hypothetical protein